MPDDETLATKRALAAVSDAVNDELDDIRSILKDIKPVDLEVFESRIDKIKLRLDGLETGLNSVLDQFNEFKLNKPAEIVRNF